MKLERKRIDSEIKTDATGDIAFLLVIFFVVTAAFAATKGLEFDLPRERPVTDGPGKPSILISIAPDETVHVDCVPMQDGQMLNYIGRRLVADPGKPVIIHPHDETPYRAMVHVLDVLARSASRGFAVDDIQIATPEIVNRYVETFDRDPFADHCSG